MTGQMPDICHYKGKKYSIVGIKGILPTPLDFGMEPYSTCTACWRGFVMEYDCVNSELLLQRMKVNTKEPQTINDIEPTTSENFFDFQFENLGLKVDFTGKLLIASDFIQSMYVHMGFQSPESFKKVIELHIDNGNLTKTVDLSSTMKKIRTRDPLKDAFPLSNSEDEVRDWIEDRFSLDY